MRTRNIYILSACLAAVLSCTEFQEENIQMNETETVEMTFTATICDETEPETKTILDGKLGDDLRKVLWTPEDAIAVVDSVGNGIYKLVNTNNVNSESTTFKGGVPLAERYLAFYPYPDSDTLIWRGFDTAEPYSFVFTIPQTQKYFPGSFATNSAPMVAKAKIGEPLNFKNLCGLLALNLTGSESIQSITFSGADAYGVSMYVSGSFLVHMSDHSELGLQPAINYGHKDWQSSKSVTLVCDEPVQLSESTATPFYFVLPPATYNTFSITIRTSDGKIMMKEGTKPLTIKRSDVQPTADLAYVETVSINLSENGVANCYIVPSAGIYSFQADVIGNGDFGLISDAGFHTDDTSISPASAELLWCDSDGAIQEVGYDSKNKRITFMATGVEGNAVIVAKDAEKNIIWSWHIWMTDQPAEHRYVNNTGEYLVLDRNLGAIRADRGSEDQWKEAQGLAYQWGRKDPFTKYRDYDYGMMEGTASYYFVTSSDQVSVEETIRNPKTFYGITHSMWMAATNTSLWKTGVKTIYDPCPAGYKVAENDIWRSFTAGGQNIYGEYDKYNIQYVNRQGWDFLYDGSGSTFYPGTWSISTEGYVHEDNEYITMWSSQNYNTTQSNTFRTYYYNESNSHVLPSDHREDITSGHMVRCMKDAVKSDVFIKVSGIKNASLTSAEVSARIDVYTGSEVEQTGFVISKDKDVTIENGTVIRTGKNTGIVSAQINNLDKNTRYYVKAFITINGNTTYSEPKSFVTITDEVHFLTNPANCYVVDTTPATYRFEMLKGNSFEVISGAHAVEVLWETFNTSETPSAGDIVAGANIYNDTWIDFTIADSSVPGNAVIAVKDNYGTILWSWHIWVADFDIEATSQNYGNGIIMMDRNLGALNIADNDSRSYGLMYQWGRKDPFVAPVSENHFAQTTPANTLSSVDNIADYNYSIQNPRVALRGSWDKNNNLWDNEKTIYDPCPAGWRVPDGSNNSPWASIGEMGWNGYGTLVYFDTIDSDMAYYPTGGYADSNFAIMQFGTEASMYTCDTLDTNIAYTFYYVNWGWAYSGSTSKEDFKYVRCQKIN